MRSSILIFTISLLFIGCSTTKHHEAYYQEILCRDLNGEMEYRLEDRTRVDCLTQKYAIEVDFAKKWAESIGQSLYYAEMTGKEPAVGLIIDSDRDQRYLRRLRRMADVYHIKIFIIEKE